MFSHMLAMVSKSANQTSTSASREKNNVASIQRSTADTKPQRSQSNSLPVSKSVSSLSSDELKLQQQKIQRLKAARRENKSHPTPKSRIIPSSSRPATKNPGSSTKPSQKSNQPTVNYKTRTIPENAITPSKPKRLNFKEMMKQAEQVDSEKLKITMKVKGSKKPVSQVSHTSSKATTPLPSSKGLSQFEKNRGSDSRASAFSSTSVQSSQRASLKASEIKHKQIDIPHKKNLKQSVRKSDKDMKSEMKVKKSHTPMPIAQPMKKLAEKQAQRKKKQESYMYDSGEDMDDFIVDDEDSDPVRYHSRDPGFDRDEIWSMFNRGKRRSDFVDADDFEDDSDMEATGAELFREEQKSLREARQEDEQEERELKRRAQEKKRRKLAMN